MSTYHFQLRAFAIPEKSHGKADFPGLTHFLKGCRCCLFLKKRKGPAAPLLSLWLHRADRLRCLVGGPPAASSGGGLRPWRPRSSPPLPLLLGCVARSLLAGLVGFGGAPRPSSLRAFAVVRLAALGRRARRAGRRCPPSGPAASPVGPCAPCAAPAGCGRAFGGLALCSPLAAAGLGLTAPPVLRGPVAASLLWSMDKLTGQGPPTYPPPLLLE